MKLPNSLHVAGALYRRTWLKTWRRPVLLTFSFVQPLMWMLFFGFLFQRYPLLDAGELRYLDYLAPGVCAMTVLFGASQSGIGLIRDLQTGFLQRMLATQAAPAAMLFGKVAADSTRLVLQATIVLGLGLLLGARVSPEWDAVCLAFVAMALFAVGFACLSCAIALVSRTQEVMATFVHVVNMPILFTSTALVPSKQMPDWLAQLSQFNPLTLAVGAWRGAWLYGRMPDSQGFLLLALFAGISGLLAALAMRRCR